MDLLVRVDWLCRDSFRVLLRGDLWIQTIHHRQIEPLQSQGIHQSGGITFTRTILNDLAWDLASNSGMGRNGR